MALYVNTNIWSLNAQRALATSQSNLTRALERLSTQLRINRSSDDPTGHAIVERYTAQINGVNQANRNVSHGTVFAQHADSNLQSINDLLKGKDVGKVHVEGIRDKIVRANGTAISAADRQLLQNEIGVLLSEVDRISQSTEFDGRKILSGAAMNTTFQVGPNAADTVSVATNDFRISRFGVNRVVGNPTGTFNGNARGGTGERITIENSLGQREQVVILAAGSSPSAKEAASAREIAKTVNAVQAGTGVSATARTEVEIVGFTAGITYGLSLETGSVPAAVDYSFALTSSGLLDQALSGAVNAFNLSPESRDTGLTMSVNAAADGIILTSAIGDNIIVGPSGLPGWPSVITLKQVGFPLTPPDNNRLAAFPANATGTVRTFTGQVTFDSERPFRIFSEALSATSPKPTPATTYPNAGLSLEEPKGTAENVSSLQKSSSVVSLSEIDVTTGLASIRDAFAVVDGAIASVTTQQAALGSAQNRFDSIITNLGRDAVNLETARGYIQDADIALETSIQTQSSIQYQLNIAILGQANALQQAVLALLR